MDVLTTFVNPKLFKIDLFYCTLSGVAVTQGVEQLSTNQRICGSVCSFFSHMSKCLCSEPPIRAPNGLGQLHSSPTFKE